MQAITFDYASVPQAEGLSEHLASRSEVGEILRQRLPTVELRAGPVIGSGSASFEMVRYLTERLPVMVAPRWILNDVQPIAVRDVLDYLVQALAVAVRNAVGQKWWFITVIKIKQLTRLPVKLGVGRHPPVCTPL